jgi:glycosyltransferase involved in cell wall biosynthesis
VRRILSLRRTLAAIRPRAVVSFLAESNIAATLASLSLGLPIIISERNHPGHDRMPYLKARLRALVYPRATRLCVQTEDIRAWFQENLGIDAAVIANPVASARSLPSAATAEPGSHHRRRAVSLGRLERQKGHDLLISAFARIADQAVGWNLVIFGEGSERARLEQSIRERGLEGRISLPGITGDAGAVLRSADLYVHAARFEGFPNAVLEALAAGLCVVASDGPGATGEILKGGGSGLLVPAEDEQALAEGLLATMTDEALRARHAASARNAVAALSPEQIARRWLGEIDSLALGPTSAPSPAFGATPAGTAARSD